MFFSTAMIDTIDAIPPENLYRVDPARNALIPYYSSVVQAGFPSPADYVEYDTRHKEKQQIEYLSDNEVVS